MPAASAGDETAKVRRTGTLTPNGEPDLVPADASDLFHPASGNELIVSRGVQYPDGSSEMAQLGVFRLTKPAFNDNGAIVATLNLQDRASVISRIDWQAPYVVPAGNNIAAVLQAAMETRYPGLDYSGFQQIEFSYPATTWGQDPSTAGDPMQDFITFAAAAGVELFFDVFGNPILRPIVNPLTSVIVADFVEGEGCTMTSAGRTLDESTAYNGVIIYCNGVGATPPFVASVWDANPSSPTYYMGKWGEVPYKMITTAIPSGSDSYAQAYAKAVAAAYAQFQLILGSFDDVTLTAVPNPALREGDCVDVGRSRLGVSGGFVISNFTMPLDAGTSMSLGFRPRVQAQ